MHSSRLLILLLSAAFPDRLPAQRACLAPVAADVVHDLDLDLPIGPYRFQLLAGQDPVTPGWTARLTSATDTAFARDYVLVATPPYRWWNPRYLDLSYGWTAVEVLAYRHRALRFARDDTDHDRMHALLEPLLWPGNHSVETVDSARAWYEAMPTGTLDLTILDGSIGTIETDPRPIVTSLRIEVRICPPPT